MRRDVCIYYSREYKLYVNQERQCCGGGPNCSILLPAILINYSSNNATQLKVDDDGDVDEGRPILPRVCFYVYIYI